MAEKLIPAKLKGGSILDIGCGSHPFFLLNIDFLHKHGLDKVRDDREYFSNGRRISITHYDVEGGDKISYEDNSFSVVTMLAVLEHIEPHKVTNVVSEVYRIMKPGGVFIITTPAVWADGILKIMAKLRLVSGEEINEHKDTYTHVKICSLIKKGGFRKENIRFGYFEMFMNLWAVAAKL